MTLGRLSLLFAVFAMCFATCTLLSFGQGSDLGTIRGIVKDSSGALIPNAHVQITNTNTLQTYQVKTNDHGSYEAPALVPGRYSVKASADGFSAKVVDGIVLHGSDIARADVNLNLAGQTVDVQVTSSAESINTDSSSLSVTLSPTAITELPSNTRDVYQFLYLNPNITQGADSSSFKFIGSQSYGASFSVDGQRSSGGIFGEHTKSQPTLDSIGEMNVLSNAFSAEYAGVANIRISTKSGGAQNHGSLFYNNLNSGLATWTMSDKADEDPHKSRFNVSNAGGSWGGPIPKLRNTFFFMAYEFDSSVSPIVELNQTGVLGPKVQGGDFSQLNVSALPPVPENLLNSVPSEYTTVNSSNQVVFTQIPENLINPVTSKLVSLYFPKVSDSSTPNPATGRLPLYSTTETGFDRQHMGDLRIDHNFNDNNRVYGVYHGSSEDSAASPVSAPYNGLGLLHRYRKNSTLSLSYTRIVTPRFVNEARGGFNTQNMYLRANQTVRQFLQSIGFTDADIATYGSAVGDSTLNMYGNTAISFGSSGIAKFGNGGRSSDRKLNQKLLTFGDTATWTVGRHVLRFGADFVRNAAQDGFSQTRNTPQGTLTYSGSGLTPYMNFLLGNGPTKAAYVYIPRPTMDVWNWENGFFVQDDFHVTSRLTMNLGMRYDRYTPYQDKNDVMINFDPNYTDSSTGQVGRYIIPSKKTLQYLSATATDLPPYGVGTVLASQSGLGVGRGLVRSDNLDWGPRIGWAYMINDKSVFRGGIGIYYPTSSAHVIRDPLATNSFNQSVTYTSTASAPISGWPTGSGGSGVAPITGGSQTGFGNFPTANYVPVDIKNPRQFEWNATYERQLPWQTTVRGSYVGGEMQGAIIGVDLDMINASDNPFGTTQGAPNLAGSFALDQNYAGPYYACDPFNSGDCNYSAADMSRVKFPMLGDYVSGFGNHGRSLTHSIQVEAERHTNHLTYSVSYTYLNQKATTPDTGNDSLGGNIYNPFDRKYDWGRDNFVSTNRLVGYALYDLPFGRGQRFGANVNHVADVLVGGWQLTTKFFSKSSIGITPYWGCGDCDPVLPGNIASGAIDPTGGFTGGFRPVLIGNPNSGRSAGHQYNAAAFGFPDLGSTLWTNPNVVKRGYLNSPSAYGINLGVHKVVRLSERLSLELGADVDNVLNHPIRMPDYGTATGSYGYLGTINVQTTVADGTQLASGVGTPNGPAQPALAPWDTDPNDGTGAYQPNDAFGLNNQSYSQEGINGNRQIRLLGRIRF